jgi:hypothetical protein
VSKCVQSFSLLSVFSGRDPDSLSFSQGQGDRGQGNCTVQRITLVVSDEGRRDPAKFEGEGS